LDLAWLMALFLATFLPAEAARPAGPRFRPPFTYEAQKAKAAWVPS
jgi:hypothetical protein